MKYVKIRNDLVLIVNPLLMLVGAALFFFATIVASSFFYAFWISTIGALCLIVLPFGHQQLAHNPDELASRLPWQQWLFCILLLEITLLGAYLGVCALSGTLFVINTPLHPTLFVDSLSRQLIHQGLFPWPFYAVITVGFGWLAYARDNNAYFSNLLYPLMKHTPQETGGLIVNVGMRRCTMFGISLLLLFMTLMFMTLALSPEIHIVTGFHPAALLTTLILLGLTYTKTMKRYIGKIFARHIPTIVGFPVFCTALCFITLFFNVTITGIVQQNTTVMVAPAIITDWIHFHWHAAWSIFSGTFWIALTAPVCGYIARLSRGYRIRHVIIGVLIFPSLIAVLLSVPAISTTLSIVLTPLVIKIIASTSFVILLPLLLNHHNSSNAILAYFPKNGVIKPRDEKRFFEQTTQLSIVFLYVYFVIGINGLSVMLFAPLFLSIPSLLLIVCVIIWNIAVKKAS